MPDSTPQANFEQLANMATEYFGTKQWRTPFMQRYGLKSHSSLTTWRDKGPPDWALVAMRDALALSQLCKAVATMEAR